MPRRAAPGRTPAREPDAPTDDTGRPSKTRRKHEAHELQALGNELAQLPESRLAELPLEPGLREALAELRRTRTHEGRRRQLQYVGKRMRQADVEPLREAVAQIKLGPARESLQLHEAERWRVALLADDAAATQWAERWPHSDLQHLRQLVRQARTEHRADAAPGQAQRQSRAYRELFRLIRDQLALPDPQPPGERHE